MITNYLVITSIVIVIIILMNSNFTKSMGKQKSYYDILNENPKFQEMKELYEAMEITPPTSLH